MTMWNDYEKIARRLDRIANAFERIANALETANIIEADRKTEPQKTTDYCDTCNHKGCENCVGDNSNPYCVPSRYEPKDEPQTDCAEALTLLWIHKFVTDDEFYRIDARLKQTERSE